MATRRIVPRGDLEGSIGSGEKRWAKAYIGNVSVTYDTIADMVADLELKEGSTAATKGAAYLNDGGAGVYAIRNRAVTDVASNTIIFLNNGLVAEAIVSLSNERSAFSESTGYGIVSGCTPAISNLTVTVGSGVVHLPNGTRKEIAQTTISLNSN